MKLRDIFFSEIQATYKPGWLAAIVGKQIAWNIRNPLPGLTRGWKDEIYSIYCYFWDPTSRQWKATFYLNRDKHLCPTWNPCGGRVLKATLAPLDRSKAGVAMVHFKSYRGRFIELAWGYKPSTGTRTLVIRRAHAKNEQGKPG